MKKYFSSVVFILIILSGSAFAQNEFTPDSIISIMHKVAKFRSVTADTLDNGWGEGATFYPGLMATYTRTQQKSYLDSAIAWSKQFSWRPYGGDALDTTRNGDNQCCFQTYAEIYLLDSLASNGYMVQKADNNFTNMFDIKPLANKRWAWCDLMYMAPAAIIRVARAVHKPRYVDSMDVYWWNSSKLYYDTTDHLYYRDNNYVGKKIFWARGNGWVFGGLSRVIPFLPANYPSRQKYITQFKEIAAKLKTLQQSDGLWRSDLLKPDTFPQKETSGTVFFCFGTAWGINAGILDRTTYEPVVRKSWTALVSLLNPNGTLSWVQGPDSKPGAAKLTISQPYADGTMLLAANEIYTMVTTVGAADKQAAGSRLAQTVPAVVMVMPGESIQVPDNAHGYEIFTVQGKKIFAERFVSKQVPAFIKMRNIENSKNMQIVRFYH